MQDVFGSTIPVVNMHDYFSGSSRDKFVKDLFSALRDVGFVGVINPGVNAEVFDLAYEMAEKFFRLDPAEKKKCLVEDASGQRGFVLSEVAKGAVAKDLKEFYHVGMDYTPDVIKKLGYRENVWPQRPEGFRAAMEAMLAELTRCRVPIEEALSLGLGCEKDFFSRLTDCGDILLRALYYPRSPQDTVARWAAEHTDISLYTILPRATASGLEVRTRAGEWIPVRVPEDAFIINAGDMLENLSNGLIRSATHRVRGDTSNDERFSMVAFIHAKPTDNVGPLPQCIAKVGERKFADTTHFNLLSERLATIGLASRDRLESLAQSQLVESMIDLGRASPATMRALADANLASPKVLAALAEGDGRVG